MRNAGIEEKVAAYAQQMSDAYRQFKPGRWNYEDGCLLKGFFDLWQSGGDTRFYQRVRAYLNEFVGVDGVLKGYDISEYNIDNIPCGRVLFPFYMITGESCFRKAIGETASQLEEHPRIPSGNFWHKKIYPHQVWLDGLYMGQPFYAMYQKLTQGESADYADIINQFLFVETTMRDARTGLYYHGYDDSREQLWADKETGLSPNFWSRAMGWLAMGLVDVIDVMGVAETEAAALRHMLRELMEAVLKYQDTKSMMWYQVTDKADSKGNYPETSATMMFAYTLVKGHRLGIFSEDEAEKGYNAFYNTMDLYLTEENGKYSLGNICSVAGLGRPPYSSETAYRDGSEAYYYSEPVVHDDPKGAGVCFMTLAQILL